MYENLNSNSMPPSLPTPWWVAVPSLSPWFHEIFDSSRFALAPLGAVSLSPHIHSYSPAESFLWFSPKRTHSHKASVGLVAFLESSKGRGRGAMVRYTILVILPTLSLLSFPPAPWRPYSVFTVVITRLGSHWKHGLWVPPLSQHVTSLPCTFFESQWTVQYLQLTRILCLSVLPSSHANRAHRRTYSTNVCPLFFLDLTDKAQVWRQ